MVAENREKKVASQTASGRKWSSFVIGDSKPPSPTDDEKPIVRPLAIRPMRVIAPITILATTANGVSAQMFEMKLRAQVAPAPKEPIPIQFPVHSLEQCIDIFENGPRLASAALATLNDEEVIMLAQNEKIQAYALEKVLGDLERAVGIHCALVCESSLVCH